MKQTKNKNNTTSTILSTERYRQLLDGFIDGFQILGYDYKYIYANKALEKQGKYTKKQLIGHKVTGLYPGIDKTQYFKKLKICMTKRIPQKMENYFTFPDGTKGWFDLTLFPVEEGVGIISRDITAKKLTEEKLEESEKKYRTLFEKMDEGFCIIEMIYDAKGNPIDYRFTETNSAFMKQTGLTDALTKTMREMVPNHEEHWFRIYGDIAKTGKAIRFENKAEAMHRYYDVFAFRVGGEGSKKVGIIFNDISERKELESSKNLFLSMISHELRTPLTPIKSQLELLHDVKMPEKKQKEMIEIILRNTTRLNNIINDLLDVSRMQAGRLKIHPSKESLEPIIKDVVSIEKESAKEKKITLTSDVQKMPKIEVDKDRITQVLINLINNSVKYSEASKIVVAAEIKNKKAHIEVKDDGKGMGKNDIDRLFTPFFAAQETKTSGGAGLGTYICKGIIELHDGKIWVESFAGKGTTFHIELPIRKKRAE